MLVVLLLLLIQTHRSFSFEDFHYQIQPQPVRINQFDDIYITNDEHFLSQVLYRFDQVHFACECQTDVERNQYEIFWSINDQILPKFNNWTNIHFVIDRESVKEPISTVTCHCIFQAINFTRMERNYRYQLYIDLKSDPSLSPIQYLISTDRMKHRFNRFLHHPHFVIITTLLFIIMIVTGSLLFLKFASCH